MKRVHPDRPTVADVLREIARGNFIEGVHFVRAEDGRPLFTGIAVDVPIGPRPSRVPR
jgi:hypothetical protein